MIPTFLIGLRETLEAALVVGVIAAFLVRRGRRDLLRWVGVGVTAAVACCVAGGLALHLLAAQLPERGQAALETVVGAVAVATVTGTVWWVRRHARDLRHRLDGAAAGALARGSGRALVAVVFLAVLREGFETAVFLVAALDGARDSAGAGVGAVLGAAVAAGLGYGVYRGGVRLDLARFFRATGLVLVVVAAGLVQTVLRSAHDAGWLDVGQQAPLDLSAVVAPGSVASALVTGVLGFAPRPALAELLGWLAYLVPMAVVVLRPARSAAPVAAGSSVAPGAVAPPS